MRLFCFPVRVHCELNVEIEELQRRVDALERENHALWKYELGFKEVMGEMSPNVYTLPSNITVYVVPRAYSDDAEGPEAKKAALELRIKALLKENQERRKYEREFKTLIFELRKLDPGNWELSPIAMLKMGFDPF